MRRLIKKIRFGFRFAGVFTRKHRLLILIGILGGILLFFYFPKLLHLFSSDGDQKIGYVGRFTAAELPLEIQRLISDGLTDILPDGQATPALATSWEIKEKGKEYLFTLRDEIYWQNQKPVSAQDINYNFNDVALKVIDQKTIKFILKEPFVPFTVVVSRPILRENFLGTGKYKVKSVRKNGQIIEKITLVPAKDKSQPKITYRFYPTEGAARTAFKLGEINILKEISSPGEIETWQPIEVASRVRLDRFVAVFFDTQNPKLANKSIRQALAYALRKNWEPRAFSPINPRSWAYNPNVKPYNFDLAKARQLLNQENGNGEERERPGEIELVTLPSLLPVAEKIKEDWQTLDIEVKIKIFNSLDEPFEVLLVTQEIPADPDQYFLWHSTQTTNISHYKSPKLDKLLEDGRKELDQEKRKEIYYDFQRFFIEDLPAIFLFHPTVYTVSRK